MTRNLQAVRIAGIEENRQHHGGRAHLLPIVKRLLFECVLVLTFVLALLSYVSDHLRRLIR